jgi:osmotically-inducible protein OsmY
MTYERTPEPRGWRKYLPAYGVVPSTVPVDETRRESQIRQARHERHERHERQDHRRRTSLLGWFVALCAGAGIAVLAVHAMRDSRSVGTQLDQAVASVRDAGNQAGQTLTDSQNLVADAGHGVVADVKSSISDTAISVKIKTALAADPALKASRINVETINGVVRLEGPAPDVASRERASVLASAPAGVKGVDNRLTLPQAGQVATVTDGALQKTAPTTINPALNPDVAASMPMPAASVALSEDARLGRSVEAALAGDAALGRKIVVSAQQGVVRLDGVVPDAGAKERALMLAGAQAGVKSVDNRLLTPEAATLLARGNTEP